MNIGRLTILFVCLLGSDSVIASELNSGQQQTRRGSNGVRQILTPPPAPPRLLLPEPRSRPDEDGLCGMTDEDVVGTVCVLMSCAAVVKVVGPFIWFLR
jgi:hypothetical protein